MSFASRRSAAVAVAALAGAGILTKLEVPGRTQAVIKARAAGLRA